MTFKEAFRPIQRVGYAVILVAVALFFIGGFLNAPASVLIGSEIILIVAFILVWLRWFRRVRPSIVNKEKSGHMHPSASYQNLK